MHVIFIYIYRYTYIYIIYIYTYVCNIYIYIYILLLSLAKSAQTLRHMALKTPPPGPSLRRTTRRGVAAPGVKDSEFHGFGPGTVKSVRGARVAAGWEEILRMKTI